MQLITAFNPVGLNSQARAVIATNSTVYVGGGFLGAGRDGCRNLVAYLHQRRASLPWNPGRATYTVWASLATTDGNASLRRRTVPKRRRPARVRPGQDRRQRHRRAGQPGSASVRNAGADSGIGSLVVQDNNVYGTAWHFGPGGNLEGVFKASRSTTPPTWSG